MSHDCDDCKAKLGLPSKSARILRFPMERIKRRASGSWQCMDDLPPVVRSQRFLTDLFRELGFDAHSPADEELLGNSSIRGAAVPRDIETSEES